MERDAMTPSTVFTLAEIAGTGVVTGEVHRLLETLEGEMSEQ